MQMNLWEIDGQIVKEDDRYIVKDNTLLKNLIVSSTTLHSGKSTSGHKHEGQEEVYMFTRGEGIIRIGVEEYPCKAGDVFVIPVGSFHRVWNPHPEFALHFMCVFEGKRNH